MDSWLNSVIDAHPRLVPWIVQQFAAIGIPALWALITPDLPGVAGEDASVTAAPY